MKRNLLITALAAQGCMPTKKLPDGRTIREEAEPITVFAIPDVYNTPTTKAYTVTEDLSLLSKKELMELALQYAFLFYVDSGCALSVLVLPSKTADEIKMVFWETINNHLDTHRVDYQELEADKHNLVGIYGNMLCEA